jgi:hypothetical protein
MRIAIFALAAALVTTIGCGSPDRDPRSLCSRYVACIGESDPQDLVAVEQLYGPMGACWLAGSSAATCAQQCQDGLRQHLDISGLHADCNSCASDLDCAGSGESLVCDTGAGKCVECLADKECRSNRPVCTPQHTCAPCTQPSQCGTGNVCTPSGFCCKPESCRTDQCGDVTDGCEGMIHCGDCARGSCVANACSTLGVACSVGDNTCVDGEACMFDKLSNAYVCMYSYLDGTSCNYGGTLPLCSFTYDLKQWETMTCIGGMCQRYCLHNGDCTVGKTCMPSSPGVAVTTDHPGSCS